MSEDAVKVIFKIRIISKLNLIKQIDKQNCYKKILKKLNKTKLKIIKINKINYHKVQLKMY